VLWLERFLAEYKGTVVAVTHDRYFLDNVAGWILELDRGRGIPFQGNYSSWLEQKQERLAHEEKTESARRRTLARELEWVRASPRARHAKAKARLGAYERCSPRSRTSSSTASRSTSRRPAARRRRDRGRRRAQGLRRPAARGRPHLLAAARRHRRRRRPERRRQDDPVPDDRGEEQPDDGTLRVGDTVELAYVDQARADLDRRTTSGRRSRAATTRSSSASAR
jgi:ATPase subunit of ABC transporter with duplicated ATPase domains